MEKTNIISEEITEEKRQEVVKILENLHINITEENKGINNEVAEITKKAKKKGKKYYILNYVAGAIATIGIISLVIITSSFGIPSPLPLMEFINKTITSWIIFGSAIVPLVIAEKAVRKQFKLLDEKSKLDAKNSQNTTFIQTIEHLLQDIDTEDYELDSNKIKDFYGLMEYENNEQFSSKTDKWSELFKFIKSEIELYNKKQEIGKEVASKIKLKPRSVAQLEILREQIIRYVSGLENKSGVQLVKKDQYES